MKFMWMDVQMSGFEGWMCGSEGRRTKIVSNVKARQNQEENQGKLTERKEKTQKEINEGFHRP